MNALQASIFVVVYGISYVLPLYASSATRPSATLSRDDPGVIRARIARTTVATAACSLSTLVWLCLVAPGGSLASSLHLMGYWPLGLAETFWAVLLTASLFVGPLLETLVLYGVWEDWLHLQPLVAVWSDMTTMRNIVAGPVTEEVMFRSASVPLLLVAGISNRAIICFSPLVFGLAHVHHFYEFRISHPQVPIAFAILRSVVQLAYTSLFGAYATFVFLRTGSLLTVVLAHALCNAVGLPRFWGHVQPRWLYDFREGNYRVSWAWTSLYYFLLVAGAVVWWRNIMTLTASEMALSTMST